MRFVADHVTLVQTVVSTRDARSWLSRPLAPGLARALAWDAGGELKPVTRDLLARSGQTEAAFFGRAGLARGPVQLRSRTTGSGAVLWSLLGGHPWVSAALLDLGGLAARIPQEWFDPVLGLLVGAPTCSSVHAHLLGTADARAALVDLAVLCQAGFQTPPQDPVLASMLPVPRPLSPLVYWWRDGELVEIPVTIDLHAGTADVRPPAAFQAAVLDRLD